jgi:hypothetical protein
LVLCVIIGGGLFQYLFCIILFDIFYLGGIGVCAYYMSKSLSFLLFQKLINRNLDDGQSTQGWKIAGIVLGIITAIVGVILILLTIFKQARNRPWQYKKQEEIYQTNDDYYGDSDSDDQRNIEGFDDNRIQSSTILRQDSPEERRNISQSAIIHMPTDGKTRETASSPMPDSTVVPFKTINSEMIFCPGCNRTHPSAHQCMYSTRIANGFAMQFRSTFQAPPQDSIAIQTEDDGNKKKLKPHTVIDRSLKYSYTTETQTDVSANPRSNITESIILRRVPLPTAKVVVQQPTTKVMIVKVPNVAGQLVLQSKSASPDEQSK